MTDSQGIPNLSSLEPLLRGQRERLRHRFFVHGSAWVLSALAASAALYFLADRLLHLPQAVRLLVSAGLGVYLAVGLQRRVLYPLRKAIALRDMAIAYERRFPELRERLVSALEFQDLLRRDDPGLRNQSRAMLEAVLHEAQDAAVQLPHERLLDPSRTRRVWGFAALFLAVFAVQAALDPEATAVFLRRALGAEVAYPRETTLVVELPPSGPDLQVAQAEGRATVTVAQGADLPVVVRAVGIVPREVYLVVAGTRGQPPQIAMAARGQGRFRHVFRRVSGAFRFHARGGDDDQGDLLVNVETVRPPNVGTIRATLAYPSYTGREAITQAGGSIEALEGTQVTLQISATAEVRQARILFQESGKELALTAQTLQDDAGTRVVWTGAFPVEKSDRYAVELLGPTGLRNPNPGTYPVVSVPDFAPVGTLLSPPDDTLNVVLPNALLPLRAEVRDDYGFARVDALLQVGKSEARITVPLFARPQGAEPVKSMVTTEVHDLTAVKAAVGDTLQISVLLEDVRAPVPLQTRLPARTLYVVTENDLLRRITGHFRQIREEVEQALGLQQDRRDRLRELLEESRAGGGGELQAALTAAEVGQGRVQGAAERVHTELMRSFDLHLFNRLEASTHAQRVVELYVQHQRAHPLAQPFQPTFYAAVAAARNDGTLGAMERTLDPILAMLTRAGRIARELAPQAVRGVAEATVAGSAAARTQALERALTRQEEIVAELQALLARLDEWNEYQDVVMQARALRDKQKDVQSRTEKVGTDPKAGGK